MKVLVLLFALATLSAGCTGRMDQPADTAPMQRASSPSSGTLQAPSPFVDLMKEARDQEWSALAIGEIAVRVGQFFIGAPYEAGMLDRGTIEELVVELESFDCVLLVETALAAARSIRDGDYSYERFLENLQLMRYRGGELDGYCSRLHYFSEWIADNERKGVVVNVTEEIGGVPLDKQLNFMGRNRESYPRFATNDSLFAGILKMESTLDGMKIFHIPQDQIRQHYDRLRTGDIIATSTKITGLDVSHTGLAVRDGDSVGFLHASTRGGVKVSPDLQDYVQNNDIQIGIVVARPL